MKLTAEEASIAHLKSEVKRLTAKLAHNSAATTLIIDAVHEAFDNDPPIITIPDKPTPDKRNKRFHENREIAVLHISDVHIGKQTRTYNSIVAAERMDILINKTIEITKTRRNWATINEIHIYLGGDIIEGEQIFPHQAHLIDQSLFDQAIRTAPSILTRAILTLASDFCKIHICGVPGNHGRNGGKHTSSSPTTNWDSVAYEITRLMVNGTKLHPHDDLARITWDLPSDPLETRYSDWFTVDRVFDWGNMIIHGHEVRGGFGGYPWYGVGRRASSWKDSIDAPWDYLYLGHYHTSAAAELQHRYMLANGRFDTDDQHALANFGGGGCPNQRLAFYNQSHGLICDSQVYLDKRSPQLIRKKHLECTI